MSTNLNGGNSGIYRAPVLAWNSVDKTFRVVVARAVEDFGWCAVFDNATPVHNGDLVAYLSSHPQVVRDEDHCQVQSLLNILQ